MSATRLRLFLTLTTLSLVTTLGIVFPQQTHGEIIHFGRITANAPTDIAAQFSADVTSVDTTHVQFSFYNTASIASSITDIYVLRDAGATSSPGMLESLTSIVDHGTRFESGANPANLPGSNLLSPQLLTDFSAQSKNHPPTLLSNGVNDSAASVDLIFSLAPSVAFSDLIDAFSSHSLRLGLHVQGIPTAAGTTSDSFVSVPEPSTLVLFSIGAFAALVTVIWRRREI